MEGQFGHSRLFPSPVTFFLPEFHTYYFYLPSSFHSLQGPSVCVNTYFQEHSFKISPTLLEVLVEDHCHVRSLIEKKKKKDTLSWKEDLAGQPPTWGERKRRYHFFLGFQHGRISRDNHEVTGDATRLPLYTNNLYFLKNLYIEFINVRIKMNLKIALS